MDDEIDHYTFLGLPSGEEGTKISEKEITKAYKKKALELHPDKRPNDREAAHADIQCLNASYAILKDAKARKLFDDLLREQLEKARRHSQHDPKQRKMMSDLERREQDAFAFDPEIKAREEEERISRKFNEEVARIRAEHAARVQAAWTGKVASSTEASRSGTGFGGRESTSNHKRSKPEGPRSGNLYRSGHKSFEASVLDKLRKAGEQQKLSSRADS